MLSLIMKRLYKYNNIVADDDINIFLYAAWVVLCWPDLHEI